jgi:hypothetical protein
VPLRRRQDTRRSGRTSVYEISSNSTRSSPRTPVDHVDDPVDGLEILDHLGAFDRDRAPLYDHPQDRHPIVAHRERSGLETLRSQDVREHVARDHVTHREGVPSIPKDRDEAAIRGEHVRDGAFREGVGREGSRRARGYALLVVCRGSGRGGPGRSGLTATCRENEGEARRHDDRRRPTSPTASGTASVNHPRVPFADTSWIPASGALPVGPTPGARRWKSGCDRGLMLVETNPGPGAQRAVYLRAWVRGLDRGMLARSIR